MSSDQLEQLLRHQFDLQHQPPAQTAAELRHFLTALSGVDGVEPGGTAAQGGRKTSHARKVREGSEAEGVG